MSEPRVGIQRLLFSMLWNALLLSMSIAVILLGAWWVVA